jgi:DNA-binding XRE family transcriptional regulator
MTKGNAWDSYNTKNVKNMNLIYAEGRVQKAWHDRCKSLGVKESDRMTALLRGDLENGLGDKSLAEAELEEKIAMDQERLKAMRKTRARTQATLADKELLGAVKEYMVELENGHKTRDTYLPTTKNLFFVTQDLGNRYGQCFPDTLMLVESCVRDTFTGEEDAEFRNNVLKLIAYVRKYGKSGILSSAEVNRVFRSQGVTT